jgi:hypothetical protein
VEPAAAFDSLAICRELSARFKGAAESEVHLFAYLACLLSLYRGWPVSSWGYGFAGTKEGAPFSKELDAAISALDRLGYLERHEGLFILGVEGEKLREELLQIASNRKRLEFLVGACSATTVMPLGLVREALSRSPDLSSVAAGEHTRALLDKPSIALLHEHFAMLSEAIGIQIEDLIVPAATWLTCLVQAGEASSSGSPT